MNRFASTQLVVIACLLVVGLKVSQGQSPDTSRIKNDLEAGRSRISDQRVSRQVEVIRLEKMIERLQERVTLLERLSLRTTQFPAVTVMEAEAGLRYAESQLAESNRLHESGELSESKVASDRLAVVRARAQIELAKAAHEDRTLTLELEVIHAERRLAEETQRQNRLGQLMARGYGSAESLKLQELDVGQAEKELARARARLEFQRKTSGIKEAERDDTTTPSEG